LSEAKGICVIMYKFEIPKEKQIRVIID